MSQIKKSKKFNRVLLFIGGVSIFLILGASYFWSKSRTVLTPDASITDYNPLIHESNFVSEINNKYFTLRPGTTFTYESKTNDGLEQVAVTVTNEKKSVLGVTTVVVWDRVWLDNELREDTKDWYAQDKDGNVWYFGEETVELIDGKVVSREGSWEAGVDGAKPGIIMKAVPKIGDTYRQEYYKGHAEDMAEVLALGESVIVPQGTYSNCLKTRDFTPLEPNVLEHKYYCPQVGGVALEIDLDGNIREELISVTFDHSGVQTSESVMEPREELETAITETEAKEVALKNVSGKVTDITLENKFGKVTYVVEIAADTGVETDVIIDANTGEVLAVET